MTVADRILDNLPWHALTGPHAPLAQGSGKARRYPRPMAVFAAAEEMNDEGWSALIELVGPGRAIVLFQPDIGPAPTELSEIGRYPSFQMVAADTPTSAELAAFEGADEITVLGANDVDEMLALTKLTAPGPFFQETYRLGTYLGIRENGRLIAMAGERLRAEGAAEISAVCTHPDAQRRGLGARLTAAMMAEIRGRGDQPLLHVARTNHGAIRIYEQLGFRIRRDIVSLAVRVGPDGGTG